MLTTSASRSSGSVPDPTEAAPPRADDGDASARISLRLSESLKTDIDVAATRDGISVNTWLVRVATAALNGPGPGAPFGRRGSGWDPRRQCTPRHPRLDQRLNKGVMMEMTTQTFAVDPNLKLVVRIGHGSLLVHGAGRAQRCDRHAEFALGFVSRDRSDPRSNCAVRHCTSRRRPDRRHL